MPANRPEQALDAYVDRVQRCLSCLASGTVIASPTQHADRRLIVFFSETHPINRGEPTGLLLRLRTHGAAGELGLRFAETCGLHASSAGYRAHPLEYNYTILDREERELFAFHWMIADPLWSEERKRQHKAFPHVHASALGSLVLPQPKNAPRTGKRTMIGNMHIPTNVLSLDRIVRFLIEEFEVDPAKGNWEAVLDEAASELER